jgi:di/tricarboxylate transporter
MGSSNHNGDDTTFVVVLLVFALVILLGLPFCLWVYLETVEQRVMVEASIRKFNKMQQQFEKDKAVKEKPEAHD